MEGVSKGARIDEQIESAYHTNCLRDVLDTLSPEKMEFVQDDSWLEMTPEQLEQAVYEAEDDMHYQSNMPRSSSDSSIRQFRSLKVYILFWRNMM